jgi:hypothetical protein
VHRSYLPTAHINTLHSVTESCAMKIFRIVVTAAQSREKAKGANCSMHMRHHTDALPRHKRCIEETATPAIAIPRAPKYATAAIVNLCSSEGELYPNAPIHED